MKVLLILLGWLAGAAMLVAAQDRTPPEPRVLAVIDSDHACRCGEAAGPEGNLAGLGDLIVLNVANLPELRRSAAALGRPIVLFLDGVEMTNLVAQPGTNRFPQAGTGGTRPAGVDPANLLSFRLTRSDENGALWRGLLRQPFARGPFESNIREYTLSAGPQRGLPLASDATLRLVIYEPRPWVAWWAAGLAAVIAAFFFLACGTEMLRDKGPVPAAGTGRRSYSLARVQMAWWSLIILISWLVIYVVTGDLNSFNSQALMLLGISGATWITATGLDQNDPRPRNNRHEFWLRDILSDRDGISIQRFQMVVWTVVLGVMFLVSVFNDLTMPEFNATLLAVMGLSAGTYVSGKFPGLATQDAPGANLQLTKPTATRSPDGTCSFAVGTLPDATSYQLWVKLPGASDFFRLMEVPAPAAGPASASLVTHHAKFPPDKPITYKWRALKGVQAGLFTEEQTV